MGTSIIDDDKIGFDTIEGKIKSEKLENIKQNRTERKSYAQKIFVFMCIYTSISLLIVVLDGFDILVLENSVVLTILGSTSANIFGLFTIVIKYLFDNDK